MAEGSRCTAVDKRGLGAERQDEGLPRSASVQVERHVVRVVPVGQPSWRSRFAAWRPAAAAERKYTGSSSNPRRMVDKGTGDLRNSSSRPSTATVTRWWRESPTSWVRTFFPKSPSSSGTTTSAEVSAALPYAVRLWCETP